MNFKKTVKDKKIWVREEELQNIPAILKKEYQLLQQSVQNDDICGALFRLKDIYEICIKLPSILSIITISARMERDRAFVRMPETQLKKEQEDFLTGREVPESDSEQQEKFRYILSHMVKEPLSIGNWRQITSSIVENAGIFALDKDLKKFWKELYCCSKSNPERCGNRGGMKMWGTGEIRRSVTVRFLSIQKRIGNRSTIWYRDCSCILEGMGILL